MKRATFKNLAEEDGRSVRQLQRVIHDYAAGLKLEVHADYSIPLVLVIDTSYFDKFGVMVFRCATRRQNIFWSFLENETNEVYMSGIEHLQQKGFKIEAIVCDGKRWLAERLSEKGFEVQLCQFHLVKNVTRYLTRRPKTDAGRELRTITLQLTKSTEADFVSDLQTWLSKWETFMNEKTFSAKNKRKWQYAHRSLRSAYRTIKNWLPHLFTYLKFPTDLVPNTTNSLDGTFSHLKEKVQLHRGVNNRTKQKMVSHFLSQSSCPK